MDFYDFFRESQEHHKKQEEEYERLRSDIPKQVSIGDKVLVAVGLLGHGFKWIRQECLVLEVKGNSVKIQLPVKHYNSDEYYEYWIDPALITDIIAKGDK